ncbi:unnamed protein product, partial [Polarella glacialis]
VGVTGNSNTSMGMLLKQSLETVALASLEPIYFASTPQAMGEVLGQMHEGLASIRGSLVNVTSDGDCCFVRVLGEPALSSINLLAGTQEQALLFVGSTPPGQLIVDGVAVLLECTDTAAWDSALATSALQGILDAVRVQRVAMGADAVRPVLEQLSRLITSFEARFEEERAATAATAGGTDLQLAKATPAARVAQHKALKRLTCDARHLRHQLADIQAYSANDSASQAAFLTGASSKYGAKALRRAGHGEALDSRQRLQEVLDDLTRIAPKMKLALRKDVCNKLATLTDDVRARLSARLEAQQRWPPVSIRALCSGELDSELELAELLDSGEVFEALAGELGIGR